MKPRNVFFIAALALQNVVAMAAPPEDPPKTILIAKPADLESLLAPIQKKYQVPGMIAAILDGEHITAIGATGVRKIGAPDLMITGDLIHLGSDTKAMTATLIGKLFDEKKIKWDTPMSEIFPKLAPEMNPEAAKITIADLLRHTAGLPANVDWWKYDRTHLALPEQRLNIVKDVLAKPPATVPGKTYAYSNVGYMMLGAILEQQRHAEWEKIIHDELFKPLGMTTADFGPPGTIGKIDEPWGHSGDPPKLVPEQSDNAPALGPAGRVHCSIEDWARFVSLHMQALRGNPHLISAESFDLLHTPAKGQGYAGGWLIAKRDWAGGAVYNHAGSNTMWYCVVWMAPKKNFAVLIATNSGQKDADKACDDAATALIDFHGKAKPAGK